MSIDVVSHGIGHDPAFLEVRKRHYAEGGLVRAGALELCRLSERESGIPYTSLMHPVGYFSPSLPGADGWNDGEWRGLFQGMSGAGGWDICRLMMLTDGQAERVRAMARRRLLPHFEAEDSFRVIDGAQTYEQYVASRSSKYNANQRRCLRLVEKAGFSFTREMTIEEIFEVFARRHGKAGPEAADDYTVTPKFRAFLGELREGFRARGRWYEMGVRDAEGKLASLVVAMRDEGGVFYLFQTCYDPEFRQMRLGAVTFERMIQDALTEGCRYISFCGDSEYMRHFTDRTLRFRRVDIHSRTPKGLYLYGRRLASKAKTRLRAMRAPAPAPAGGTT